MKSKKQMSKADIQEIEQAFRDGFYVHIEFNDGTQRGYHVAAYQLLRSGGKEDFPMLQLALYVGPHKGSINSRELNFPFQCFRCFSVDLRNGVD